MELPSSSYRPSENFQAPELEERTVFEVVQTLAAAVVAERIQLVAVPVMASLLP